MEKFTVIILHYNQMSYIETAILSVLNQNYKKIELIVTDDGSSEFDKDKVSEIIEKHNKNHFDYKILDHKKNVGTVKNLNKTLKKATGDFILFFAADDKLYNKEVISNFSKEFKNNEKNIITSQCIMYDDKLENALYDYVNPKMALQLNKKSVNEIYEKMCEGCFYGSGATCYRKSIFEKYGYFNENYQLVEDWSYWLYLLRSGEKIYYSNFNTLCHRDGGVSHNNDTNEIPPHVKKYYIDIINIYSNEILPYVGQFNVKQRYRILKKYNHSIIYYSGYVSGLSKYLSELDKVRLADEKLKYYWKWRTFLAIFNVGIVEKIKYQLANKKEIPITYIVWVAICILLINNLNIKDSNILLFMYLLCYIIIYYVVCILKNAIDCFNKDDK